MKIQRIMLSALLVGMGASVSAAQDVHTDWDKHATFERYHNYCWGQVQTSNPLWKSRIEEAIDKDLQGKGWQRSDSKCDVTVAAVGATQNQQEYQTYYDGLGGGWRWHGFGEQATTTVTNYKVGTLVVDMYDTNNKQLIFRGTASDTLAKDPQHNEKNLDKAVDKMFKNFPPGK